VVEVIAASDSGGTNLAMQGNAGSEADRSHANQSRTNAIAAGAAWTNKILRLTVAAP
jgi:hypothetical protein